MARRLKDYYQKELSVYNVDEYLVQAIADGLSEIEVDKDELLIIIRYGVFSNVYSQSIVDSKEGVERRVLGLKLKVV